MTHTSGRLLARNTLWNLVGQAAPMVAAVATIPVLIHSIGTERFAILTLAWIVIGYFSLFDLGLSRALTQVVADRLGASSGARDLPEVVWTALALMSALGVAGALLLAAVSPWLVTRALNVPPRLHAETIGSMYLLAVGLPFVISTGGARGVLEAYQRFDVVNAIRIPAGMFSYLGPLAVLPFSRSLVPVVGVLVAGRVAGWAVHLAFCARIVPGMRARIAVHPRLVGPLMRFGGWMTVTNIVTPLMTYGDRFMLGALLPVAAVAYYVTPYELITKLWLIPGSVAGVVFPALATSFARDRGRAAGILFGAVRANVAALFPAVLVLAAFAPEGLHLWLGAEFAREGAPVLRWLAAGMLVNCVGQMAGVAVQGAGRPDLTAKLHLAELPVYMGVLYLAAVRYGVQGAAAAWSVRMVLDTALLLALAHRLLPGSGRMLRWAAVALGATGAALAAVSLPQSLAVRAAVCVLALLVLGPLGWRYALLPPERGRVAAALRARRLGAIFP